MTTEITTEFAEFAEYIPMVADGARVLDERRPDWFRTIDTGVLDIFHSERCVTAQLSGCADFLAGCSDLELDVLERFEWGFDVRTNLHTPEENTRRYACLTRLWLHEIHRRLTA